MDQVKVAEQRKSLEEMKAEYPLGFQDKDVAYDLVLPKGLSEEAVRKISAYKNEPEWMLELRLKALAHFKERGLPAWGPWAEELKRIKFDEITYFAAAGSGEETSWEELPDEIRETFEKIGIPRIEQERLVSGSAAQYDSLVAYHAMQEELVKQGVVFLSTDEALQQYPEIFKKYFGSVIPYKDNFAAALNTAFWSGGSTVIIPKGVQVDLPLSAYFRINASQFFQAERTLIIAEEGSRVSYSEGCVCAGEQISIGDKMVNVESIHPGDGIVVSSGRKEKVKETMVREYSGDVIEITPMSSGNKFTVTPEHPILCLSRNKVSTAKHFPDRNFAPVTNRQELHSATPEYLPANKLREGDFLVFPKILGAQKPTGYSEAELILLGWYLAEGCAYHNEKRKYKHTTFSFHIDETEYIEEVCDAIYKISGRKALKTMRPEEKTCEVRSTSPIIHDFCLEACGRMAVRKELSSKVMNAPLGEISIILDRYSKGDGCDFHRKATNSNQIVLGTSSKVLAYQLQEILARQSIFASISVRPPNDYKVIRGRVTQERERYLVRYTVNSQRSQHYDRGEYFLVPVKNIDVQKYNGFVFNLHVRNDPSYLARGFVVHNCSAPSYKKEDSVHAAVVEIIAMPGSDVTYFTSQNWSTGAHGGGGVYNLVTKRALAMEGSTVRWIQAEIGSRLNIKYPSIYCVGKGARGEIYSMAFAGEGQQQDTGGKLILAAPDTSGVIVSKSISKDGGTASYRGLVEVSPKADRSKVKVVCDALLLDEESVSNTWPTMHVNNDDCQVEHEATVSKIGEEQIFYLRSRGLSEQEAMRMIVGGFSEPVVSKMPLEFSVELVRLMELQMEGSVG